ncbi:MAG: RHS repeat-associated core domain-containing protein [Terriglobales bacterium]
MVLAAQGIPAGNPSNQAHFQARNYTSTWGRWMTPDWAASPASVPYASLSNPQTLDLYGYALGNPTTNADPDGHWCFLGRFGTTCPAKQPAKSADPTHPNNPLAVDEQETNPYNQALLQTGTTEAQGTASAVATLQAHPLAMQAGFLALQFVPGVGEAADAEEGATYVIGKVSDLEADEALLPGEKTVASEIPDLTGATEQEKWTANSSAFRRIMGEGQPIRDASGSTGEAYKASNTGFLRMERNLLETHGWVQRDGWWFPPK